MLEPLQYRIADFITDKEEISKWCERQSLEVKQVTSIDISRGLIIQKPYIEEGAFVSPQAVLIGGVLVKSGCFIAPYAVIRLDEKRGLEPLIIGNNSNVQDHACVHANTVSIGSKVIVAHSAIVHGAVIEDDVTLYIRAVADGARIGRGSFLDAGCYVGKGVTLAPDTYVPAGEIVLDDKKAGTLGKVPDAKKAVRNHVLEDNAEHTKRYLAKQRLNII